MRVVADANVLVSALLSRTGAPARLVEHWLAGSFELVVSPRLLEEVERAWRYSKIAKRLDPATASAFLALLEELGESVDDPSGDPPLHSEDPGDDYLIALAAHAEAMIVSGDDHLLGLAGRAPVLTPRMLLDELGG